MTTRTTALASFLTVFALVGIALVVAQPSLTPPAGPITESGRFGTLIEINDDTAPGDDTHRHIISVPGSYYLSGDLDAGTQSGILIATDNVTLDLNGFTIVGDENLEGTAGIDVSPAQQVDSQTLGVRVRNGRIVGFETGVNGRDADFTPEFEIVLSEFRSLALEDLQVTATLTGIEAAYARIARCSVLAPGFGILAFGAIIESCEVRLGNGSSFFSTGIEAGDSTVLRCTVDTTGVEGSAIGISVGRSVVAHSRVTGNAGLGFSIFAGSVADGCFSDPNVVNDIAGDAQTFSSNF